MSPVNRYCRRCGKSQPHTEADTGLLCEACRHHRAWSPAEMVRREARNAPKTAEFYNGDPPEGAEVEEPCG